LWTPQSKKRRKQSELDRKRFASDRDDKEKAAKDLQVGAESLS
jgi:hypothetical protein